MTAKNLTCWAFGLGLLLTLPGDAAAQVIFYRPGGLGTPSLANYPSVGFNNPGYGFGPGYGNAGFGYPYSGPVQSAAYPVTVSPGFGASGNAYPRLRSSLTPAVGVAANSPLLDVGSLAPDPQAQIIVTIADPDAQIWFDGTGTTQTGTVRTFWTPLLEPGRPYSYEIQARWTDAAGEVHTTTRTVTFRAGDSIRADF